MDLILSRFVFHFALAFCFIEVNRYYLRRQQKGKRRLLLWYTANFLLFLVLCGLFALILLAGYTSRPLLAIGTSYFHSFFVWLAAVLIGNFITVLQENRDIQAENALLKQQSLQAQLDSLKAQLNPHFLFNSLNALSSLIREGGPKSQQYLTKLSQVLRYSLQVQQQTLVPFADEMQFTMAYMYLLTIRYGTNLLIENQLPQQAPWFIPPMSLQLLIENAVKHNVVSTARPLTIYLTVDEDKTHLVVYNPIQPKAAPAEGMGNGLMNLDSRFRLLTSKPIRIRQTTESFWVYLPILTAASSSHRVSAL